jgi:hypothetical protein
MRRELYDIQRSTWRVTYSESIFITTVVRFCFLFHTVPLITLAGMDKVWDKQIAHELALVRFH